MILWILLFFLDRGVCFGNVLFFDVVLSCDVYSF